MADDSSRIDGSTLCMQCGLCCHGVLHEWGHLREEEAEPLAALGMEVERRPDYLTFVLPCPKVEGTICTIYEQRPAACAGYQCALLKRYLAGDIALEGALPLVEETRQRLADLKAGLPVGASLREFRREWRARMSGAEAHEWTSDERSQSGGAYLRLAMLNMYVDRYFRLDREKMFMGGDEQVAESGEGKTAAFPVASPPR